MLTITPQMWLLTREVFIQIYILSVGNPMFSCTLTSCCYLSPIRIQCWYNVQHHFFKHLKLLIKSNISYTKLKKTTNIVKIYRDLFFHHLLPYVKEKNLQKTSIWKLSYYLINPNVVFLYTVKVRAITLKIKSKNERRHKKSPSHYFKLLHTIIYPTYVHQFEEQKSL